MFRLVFLAAVAFGVATQAGAQSFWRVDPERSRIAFVITEDGTPREGVFERFSGRGVFWPDFPTQSELDLVIETGSIDLNDRFRTDFVRGRAWLSVERHPRARYSLSRLTPGDAPDVFFVDGALTIKGVERPFRIPVTITFDGDLARAQGVLRFDRADFNIGDRSASLFVDLGDDVEVRFDLTAVRN